MFSWQGTLSPEQTAQIAATKAVIYDGLKAAVAVGVPGFIGFAVGRTTFWDPLMAWKEQKISRKAALAEIAQRYRQWVDTFEKAHVT